MDISHQLEGINKELESVQNKIQTIIHTLQAEQNEENPLEQGEEYARLQDEGHSVPDIVEMTRKNGQFVKNRRQFVSDRIKLWKADPMLKKALEEGDLNLDRAKYIARLVKDPRLQQALVELVKKSPRYYREIKHMNKQALVELAEKSLKE